MSSRYVDTVLHQRTSILVLPVKCSGVFGSTLPTAIDPSTPLPLANSPTLFIDATMKRNFCREDAEEAAAIPHSRDYSESSFMVGG
jgi:hypothetical protein